MLQGLPELLRGNTPHWYRNNRQAWTEWGDFVNAFREQFFPCRYRFQLKQEIRRRHQQPNEDFQQYATALATIIATSGGFSRRDQIDQIYENISPELKLYIRKENVHMLGELGAQATEIEDIERQKSERPRTRLLAHRPPPLFITLPSAVGVVNREDTREETATDHRSASVHNAKKTVSSPRTVTLVRETPNRPRD